MHRAQTDSKAGGDRAEGTTPPYRGDHQPSFGGNFFSSIAHRATKRFGAQTQ
jgi:hypothetical protein